jgi:hypothetical protein
MLRAECGIKDNDPAPVVLEKLRAHVFATCAPLVGTEESEVIVTDLASALGVKTTRHASGAPVMSTLVGDRSAEPQARESRGAADPRSAADALLRSLRAFLMAKARTAPLLLVFDDLPGRRRACSICSGSSCCGAARPPSCSYVWLGPSCKNATRNGVPGYATTPPLGSPRCRRTSAGG